MIKKKWKKIALNALIPLIDAFNNKIDAISADVATA